jgi:hypothetical protein
MASHECDFHLLPCHVSQPVRSHLKHIALFASIGPPTAVTFSVMRQLKAGKKRLNQTNQIEETSWLSTSSTP